MITKEKWDALAERMKQLGIREEDLIEKFILGSGRGGQNLQKTSSTVFLKHIPTGLIVKCQRDRNREMNRYIARRELCEKLETQILKKASAKQQEMEKIRRQKRRRTRRQKEKMLADKKQRGEVKKMRLPPSGD